MATARSVWRGVIFSLGLLTLVQALPAARANEPKDLVGIWKNQIEDPLTGGWRTLCWYSFGLQGGASAMGGIDFSVVSSDVGTPRNFSNIRLSRERWAFVADVGGRAFQFDFHKVSATEYEGRFAVNGQIQPQRRRLVKIVDRGQLRNEIEVVLAQLAIARSTTEQLIAQSRQNQQYWRDEADRARIAGNTGALQGLFHIQATGTVGRDTIYLQQVIERIRAANAAKAQLRD